MNAKHFVLSLAILLPNTSHASILDGVGTIADSYTDEYQFENYPAPAFNWVELLATERDVNFGSFHTTTWGEPRRQGYEFNWARSGATAMTGLQAQLDGLLPQINAGDVSLVYLNLGINDYGARYFDLHNGTLSGDALDQFTDDIISRLSNAADQVTAAGAKLVVGNLLDMGVFTVANTSESGRARVSEAMTMVNERIRDEVAFPRGAPIIDIFHITNSTPVIGGVQMLRDGLPPGHPQGVFVDVVHLGTAMQGLVANAFVEAVNQTYGADVSPLSDQAIWDVSRQVSGMHVVGVPGDADGDFDVDLDDLNAVRNNFGCFRGYCAGDATGDLDVNLDDLDAVRNNFGYVSEPTYFDVSGFVLPPPAAANAVPEPSGLDLAVLALVPAVMWGVALCARQHAPNCPCSSR